MSKELKYRDFLCTYECETIFEKCTPCRCHCCCPPYPPPCPPYPPPYPPYPPMPTFLSGYFEVLGGSQTREAGELIVFDRDSADSVGDVAGLNDDGTVITINRPGIYLIEWNVNVTQEQDSTAVIGIIENGEPATGASHSGSGNLSSGTLIYVDETPFTISLINYAGQVMIADHPQYEDSSVSIRIVKIADLPPV